MERSLSDTSYAYSLTHQKASYVEFHLKGGCRKVRLECCADKVGYPQTEV